LRILPLHAEIRDLEQTLDNVGIARETLTISSGALQEASTIMARARELVMQGANGSYGANERARMADEIDQILDQMLTLANTRRGSRYLFSGSMTESPSFRLANDAGGSRVIYGGDHGSITLEVAPGIRSAIGSPGDALFQTRSRGATTILDGTTGAQPSGATDSGVGFDRLAVSFGGISGAPSTVTVGSGTSDAVGPLGYVFASGPATLSIGGGPALPIPVTNGSFTTSDGRTISLNVSGVPATTSGVFNAVANLSSDGNTSVTVVDFSGSTAQVRNSFADTVLNLDVSNLRRTGTDLVQYGGTFDVFTALIAVRDTMRNPLGVPEQKVGQRLTALLGELDTAHDDLLAGLQTLGHRAEGMQLLQGRVSELRNTTRESLSNVEDTDLSESIVSYQQKQLAYQAALQVGGRVLSVSLLNFLR
jgi:flagellar hook-associated protein 3 FlgL